MTVRRSIARPGEKREPPSWTAREQVDQGRRVTRTRPRLGRSCSFRPASGCPGPRDRSSQPLYGAGSRAAGSSPPRLRSRPARLRRKREAQPRAERGRANRRLGGVDAGDRTRASRFLGQLLRLPDRGGPDLTLPTTRRAGGAARADDGPLGTRGQAADSAVAAQLPPRAALTRTNLGQGIPALRVAPVGEDLSVRSRRSHRGEAPSGAGSGAGRARL